MSLERKLPLLMIGVLVAVLAGTLGATYGTLAFTAEDAARERLSRAVDAVASTVEAATAARGAALLEVSREQPIRAALLQPGDSATIAAAVAHLEQQMQPGDSLLPLELWDADGRRIAFAGNDLPPSHREADPPGLTTSGGSDSVRFSPMAYVDGSIYFWAAARISEAGRTTGWLAHRRRVQAAPDANRSLTGLTGEQVALYTRNSDGSLWSKVPAVPDSAPRVVSSGDELTHERPGVGRLLAVESEVEGTPWVAVLESPMDAVFARARRTVLTLALLSILLISLGGIAAWLISRRITRPLTQLTVAAESVANGSAADLVHVSGGDEIARLAASFNEMSQEVAASRKELERRIAEAQAAARDLEQANADLQLAMEATERARREALDAQQEAERANRAKSDFLAVMSHELRTPLNAIGGYAELLQMGLHGSLNDAQNDAINRILRGQNRLLTLINDVLNFAKLDAGQLSYQIDDISLDEVLSGMETLIGPQLRAKALDFRYEQCDSSIVARADRDKVEQIVLNLLTNAIKFTPSGGTVRVECHASGEKVQIHVADTGVGIQEERLVSIFEPFVQADRALSRPSEGVGLGLAISRELARAMGGDIEVSSVVNVGSTFVVSLPRGKATNISATEEEVAGTP
jgi:signal transduction histidine kinase